MDNDCAKCGSGPVAWVHISAKGHDFVAKAVVSRWLNEAEDDDDPRTFWNEDDGDYPGGPDDH